MDAGYPGIFIFAVCMACSPVRLPGLLKADMDAQSCWQIIWGKLEVENERGPTILSGIVLKFIIVVEFRSLAVET